MAAGNGFMYDNVHLWLTRPISNASAMADRYNGTPIADKETGDVMGYRWHIRNLRVSCFQNGISVQGSLPKFLCGDNVNTISAADTTQAIATISNLLGVEMAEAKVTYLEFGQTFITDKAPIVYFEKLGDAGRYLPRLQVDTTLYYGRQVKNAPKVIAIYDKAKEIARNGDILPKLLDGVNLLRYELRLRGRLNARFGIGAASALADKNIFAVLKKEFIESFECIKKIPSMAAETKPTKDWVFANLIALHPDDVKALLSSAKVRVTPQEYYRLKNAIEQTLIKASAKGDTLLQELSDAVISI